MSKDDRTVKIETILDRAALVLKIQSLPSHNAFTISEVVAAVTGLPKEYVIEQMLERK